METIVLPLITDAPAANLPAPGDPPGEPLVVQLAASDGTTYIVPLTSAAAQALVQLLLRSAEPEQAGAAVRVPCPADLALG